MTSTNKEDPLNQTFLESLKGLWATFSDYSTTHGLQRIADSVEKFRKCVWIIIVLSSVTGCTYHCSFIIGRYLEFPKVTTAEEIHARELEFPALTVCNLNILKKSFLEDQLEKNKNETKEISKGFCFTSDESFLNQSQAKDLSDIWSKLGITAAHLRQYGHKVYDLIVQCTYNNVDCFNQTITSDLPMQTENVSITEYISSKLGYCHTVVLNAETLGKVRKGGQTRGLTLTLNIERDQYLDLLSPEYGVRLIIHPKNSFPTIERGGLSLHPGTKTYVSMRIRHILRLPAPYGDCTQDFADSPVSELLKSLDPDFILKHEYYTYEYCQALCRETLLLKNCSCVEEQLNIKHMFCNPCNDTQETCRTKFTEEFEGKDNNICTTLCKPGCEDVRYDATLSRSEWPNMDFQAYVLRRWPELIPDFIENITRDMNYAYENITLNETYINKNFLRVHVFIQEMNYLLFKDIEAYSLPEMFADLGGCLGLYIGASVISIIEFLEFFTRVGCSISDRATCDRRRRHFKQSSSNHRRNALRIPRSWPSANMKAHHLKRRPYNSRMSSSNAPVYWVQQRVRGEDIQGDVIVNGGAPHLGHLQGLFDSNTDICKLANGSTTVFSSCDQQNNSSRYCYYNEEVNLSCAYKIHDFEWAAHMLPSSEQDYRENDEAPNIWKTSRSDVRRFSRNSTSQENFHVSNSLPDSCKYVEDTGQPNEV